MRQFQLRRRRAESTAGASVTSVLEALHQRVPATRRGAAAGSSVAPDAAAPDAAAPDGGGADGGGAELPWYELVAPLLRCSLLGLLDPLALFGLMTAAVVRLVGIRVRVGVRVRVRVRVRARAS